jgi:hypothetical protein
MKIKDKKYCKKCKLEKPTTDFYKIIVNNKRKGYSVYCKPCQIKHNVEINKNLPKDVKRKYNRTWKAKKIKKDPNYNKELYSRWKNKLIKNPARFKAIRFFNNLHGKGKANWDRELSVEYFENLFNTIKACQCCGTELVIEPPLIKGLKRKNAATVDRIDNSKGYSKENIGIICLECNTRKRDLLLSDFEMIVKYIRRGNHV